MYHSKVLVDSIATDTRYWIVEKSTQMKITLVLAAVAAYVYAEAECCEDIGEYEAGCIPEAL
jgi:hypothetical protein